MGLIIETFFACCSDVPSFTLFRLFRLRLPLTAVKNLDSSQVYAILWKNASNLGCLALSAQALVQFLSRLAQKEPSPIVPLKKWPENPCYWFHCDWVANCLQEWGHCPISNKFLLLDRPWTHCPSSNSTENILRFWAFRDGNKFQRKLNCRKHRVFF